ncbi:MAG: hypothetical protein D6736_17450 [Nitrospinota bacterium]|nr:MAG: hypothetical protein D6736_17450 [Nitrospinota bacterium]
MEKYQQAQALVQRFFLEQTEAAASFLEDLRAFTQGSFPWEFPGEPSPPEDLDIIPAPLCYGIQHEMWVRRCAYTVNKAIRQILHRLLIAAPSLSPLAAWGLGKTTLGILEEWKRRRGDLGPINGRLDFFLELPTMRSWLVEENRIKGGLREIGDLLALFFRQSTLYRMLTGTGFALRLHYPFRERLRWFYQTYRQWKGKEALPRPTLFLWTRSDHPQREERCFRQLVEWFPQHYPPLRIRIADNQQGWCYRNGQLFYEEEPVEMVFRFEKLARIEDYAYVAPLFEAYFDRRILLDTPPAAEVADNKMIQVLLSDPDYRSSLALSPAEQSLLSRILPPSRLLTAGEESYALQERERLVLKTLTGAGGSGTVFGRDFSKARWEDQIKKLTGQGLLQELRPPYVTLLPLPLQGRMTVLPVKYGFDIFTSGRLSYDIEGIAVRGKVIWEEDDLYETINMGAKGPGQKRGKLLLPLLVL